LVVGWASQPPDLTGSAELFNLVPGETALNGWVRIAADGTVTVAAPRADMGQGIGSTLAALVAEELDVPWERVRVEMPPQHAIYANTTMLTDGMAVLPEAGGGPWARLTRQLAANGVRQLGLIGTGGSSSVRGAWQPMRLAGAAARQLLIKAAARRWEVDAATCETSAGQVLHRSTSRSLTYGELAPSAARLSLSGAPQLRNPDQWRLIGKGFARIDVTAKVSGAAQFGIDVVQPHQLHAAVRLSPQPGGELLKLNAEAVLALPGIEAVVRVPGGVAVVAGEWWRASQALAQLDLEFTTPAEFRSDDELRKRYLELADHGAAQVHETRGDQRVAQAGPAAGSAQVIERDFHLPFLAHATMEPMNCMARVMDGRCEVWMGHQIPTLLRWFAARAADVPTDRVVFHPAPLGGGFGRRMEVDLVVQAVTIAAQLHGRPVKLIWTREDDLRHDVYRPMAVIRQRAAVDAAGRLLSWHARVVTPSVLKSIYQRILPIAASDRLPDKTAVDGATALPYAVNALRVEHVPAPAGLPVGFWRGVGHSINAFASEAMIDELGSSIGQDGLRFREQLLAGQSRHLAVLRAAAQEAGWDTPPPAGGGRGIALHACFGSIIAMVVEVVTGEGRLRVRRITAAVDCGQAIDPDTVRGQIEGGALFGLSAALYGRIHFVDGSVRESNFHDYPCLRMADTPTVGVTIVASPAAPIGGIGEVGVPPVAPALAAALFAATGQRQRELPLSLAHGAVPGER
jgi:isoquinoline 1-oxidoreductase beta subunit